MTHKVSFSIHKGNWFQELHGYQNLWMLKSLICNNVEQCIKLALCTHRFQRRGSKIVFNLQLVDSAGSKPGDMEGLLCNYWEKMVSKWTRNSNLFCSRVNCPLKWIHLDLSILIFCNSDYIDL